MKINKRQLDRIKKFLYGKESGIVYPTNDDILRAAEMLEPCKVKTLWSSREVQYTLYYEEYKCPNGTIILISFSDTDASIDLAFRMLNPDKPTPQMDALTVRCLYPRDRPLEHIDVKSLFTTIPL